MRFKDKIVLVTGSSRNTGLGIAECFLKEGAFVIINGSTEESTQKGAVALREKGFSNFLPISADLSRKEEIDVMFDRIIKECGRLDILVNNAVIQCCGFTFLDLPYDEFDKTLRTNLYATWYCGQRAAKMMIAQKNGVIVNFSSNVSVRAIHDRTAYCASKGGVDALTRSMAIDLAPYGIRVNAVAPGYIYTNRWDVLTEDHKARRRQNVPLGREAYPDDIAAVVMFLASDESRIMTGERLVADGGTTAQHMPVDIDI